jgi:RNA polymerase sigma-70 factor (ECF subfamily)
VIEDKRIYLDKDTQLMVRAAEGDVDIFNIIYKKYFRIVADYAKSVNGHANSSEDITNEVFKRVWQQREEYKPTAKVKTYLFSFARTVVQEHRRRTKYQRSALDNYSPITAEQPDSEVVVQNMELRETIEKAKSKLSEKQRQAIEFVFYSNISIDEAAKLAGCSYVVFCSRIKDAKKHLAKLLKQFRDY